MSVKPTAYLDPPPRPPFAMPVPPPGKRLISLAINESPFGCSPKAVAAAAERAQSLNRYPDPASNELRAALARHHGLERDRIICGNGSEELLDVIARLFARPGDEILMSQSGFFQFALAAARTGASLKRVPERDYVTDIDALLTMLTPASKIAFLAVPNNPTGISIPVNDVRRLVKQLPPYVVLVLDLAYGEYMPEEDLAALMDLEAPNLIKTRTFSKAYGLAALRLGWLVAPIWMVPGLNQLRGIGSVNAVAQAAGLAALADDAFMKNAVAQTAAQRDFLAETLRRLGVGFLGGHGNFLLTRFPGDRPAEDFVRLAMAEEGIWLRPVGEPGFPNWLRLGVGTADEMALLAALLQRFMMTGR